MGGFRKKIILGEVTQIPEDKYGITYMWMIAAKSLIAGHKSM